MPFFNEHKPWREGSDIIDGYLFRGKHTFNKTLHGLKNIMKKGVDNKIGGVKYKALDTRVKGNGLEIDVEMVESKKRGVGILKLYGPKVHSFVIIRMTDISILRSALLGILM